MNEITFVIITVSDSCYQNKAIDKSGPILQQLIKDNYTNCSIITELVPDEFSLIEKILLMHCHTDINNVKLIFTTGGTGFAPRDVTPEATRSVIERECPQLSLAMSLESFKKTPFAALSRAICGIRQQTLIINLPGSPKAVIECFDSIKSLLPHIVHLMSNNLELIIKEHQNIQSDMGGHVCPHKTGTGEQNDRNSIYPMLPVKDALNIIFSVVKIQLEYSSNLLNFKSPINIPPFRASIKDGYAMKSSGLSGIKKVLSIVSAGDKIIFDNFADDECYKINTGAPMPEYADCVIQIEDTKLIRTKKNGEEDLVEILVQPKSNLDIRQIGADLKKDSAIFPISDFSDITIKSILASVGSQFKQTKPKIGIISTGSELLSPGVGKEISGKIFDSNTTMLEELLKYFGFECVQKIIVTDNFNEVKSSVVDLFKITDFVICTGGVSMGDKDYIKPVLKDLDFQINFGRVNMKPGKPMTFASKNQKYFFGLPGNPVSAFVTFHLFVLPAIRWSSGWEKNKCNLATLKVTLENEKLLLDPRPEYVRAQITSRNGKLFAKVNSNQMSSRLQSICGADVLLHLPGRTVFKSNAIAGDVFDAFIIRYDFISKYE